MILMSQYRALSVLVRESPASGNIDLFDGTSRSSTLAFDFVVLDSEPLVVLQLPLIVMLTYFQWTSLPHSPGYLSVQSRSRCVGNASTSDSGWNAGSDLPV